MRAERIRWIGLLALVSLAAGVAIAQQQAHFDSTGQLDQDEGAAGDTLQDGTCSRRQGT
jgi:hypothetical protein